MLTFIWLLIFIHGSHMLLLIEVKPLFCIISRWLIWNHIQKIIDFFLNCFSSWNSAALGGCPYILNFTVDLRVGYWFVIFVTPCKVRKWLVLFLHYIWIQQLSWAVGFVHGGHSKVQVARFESIPDAYQKLLYVSLLMSASTRSTCIHFHSRFSKFFRFRFALVLVRSVPACIGSVTKIQPPARLPPWTARRSPRSASQPASQPSWPFPCGVGSGLVHCFHALREDFCALGAESSDRFL